MTSTNKTFEKISLENREVFCVFTRHPRAKHLKIRIDSRGFVRVTIPPFTTKYRAKIFLKQKSAWVLGKLENLPQDPVQADAVRKSDFSKNKERAREIIHTKLEKWNAYYQFSYGRVAIKNTTSRWGSCSRKGNLNFHYRTAFLPEELCDYVIVHELCHLKELNHSQRFWALVSKTIADVSRKRKALKQYERFSRI